MAITTPSPSLHNSSNTQANIFDCTKRGGAQENICIQIDPQNLPFPNLPPLQEKNPRPCFGINPPDCSLLNLRTPGKGVFQQSSSRKRRKKKKPFDINELRMQNAFLRNSILGYREKITVLKKTITDLKNNIDQQRSSNIISYAFHGIEVIGISILSMVAWRYRRKFNQLEMLNTKQNLTIPISLGKQRLINSNEDRSSEDLL